MGGNSSQPRGILTQADREFLAGERDVTVQTARNARRRIRNRVYQALHDFQILWLLLDDDDMELIFDSDSADRKRIIRSSIQDMIAFAILGLWENNDYYPPRIRGAIQQAAYARNRRVSVSLEIEEALMDHRIKSFTSCLIRDSSTPHSRSSRSR